MGRRSDAILDSGEEDETVKASDASKKRKSYKENDNSEGDDSVVSESGTRKSKRSKKKQSCREASEESGAESEADEEVDLAKSSSRTSSRKKRSKVTENASDNESGAKEETEPAQSSNGKSGRKRKSKAADNTSDEESAPEETEPAQSSNGKSGRKRKSKAADNTSDEESAPNAKTKSTGTTKSPKKSAKKTKPESDPEYEVVAIVGDRAIKGRLQYKVRWKGYQSEDDTWENESNLDCTELIEEYNDGKGESKVDRSSSAPTSSPSRATASSKKTKKNKKKATTRQYERGGPAQNGEWEVLRIIDMHTLRNGSREFLVRWKGYPPEDDSWEPENHLEGTELLGKFLQEVEQRKLVDDKQLRVQRKPTQRFTAMPQSNLRKGSKRFNNKQRVRYFDAE